MTPLQAPPSASSPTQHGQGPRHEHASKSCPSILYATFFPFLRSVSGKLLTGRVATRSVDCGAAPNLEGGRRSEDHSHFRFLPSLRVMARTVSALGVAAIQQAVYMAM